jgi:hypothetical protein
LFKNGKIAEAKESFEKGLAGNEKFYDREHAVSLLGNIVALIE